MDQAQAKHHFLQAAAGIGGFVILNFVWNFFAGVYARLLRPGKNLKAKYGKWAIVTGATDGIGKAMAFEFARKGLNVVIISRNQGRLDECKSEIQAKYPKQEVRTCSIDFSNFDEKARAVVAKLISDIEVGVLVNNVGISYPYCQYFHELEDERVAQLMSLNVDSTTWMTRLVLPQMVERKRGSIVNIGSAAGVGAAPLLAEYGAAKSYVTTLSKALNTEYASTGIHCQCQVALFVATKLAKIRKASLFVASPEGYARAAVAAIGYETVVSPFWSHALQIWAMGALPEWMVNKIVLNMHKGIRKAGMKKEGKVDDKKKA